MEAVNAGPRPRNHIYVFFGTAVLSIAYQTESRTEWRIQESLDIKKNPDKVIALATSDRWIAKLLPLVDVLNSIGHEQISEGKFYHSDSIFPIIGTVINAWRVQKYEAGKSFALEGTTAWLRPKLEYELGQGPNGRKKFKVTLSFGKRSILFQTFVAPVITFPFERLLRGNLGRFRKEIHQLDRGRRASGENESKTSGRDTTYVG